MTTAGPGIVPRWEWRTFGDLGPVHDEIAALVTGETQVSDELYVLSVHRDASVKVRDGLLDVKLLDAVGEDGLILRYDGARWYRQESPVDVELRGVWGTGPTEVYAVGEEGTILRFDGVAWQKLAAPIDDLIIGIGGADQPLLVGTRRIVLRGS